MNYGFARRIARTMSAAASNPSSGLVRADASRRRRICFKPLRDFAKIKSAMRKCSALSRHSADTVFLCAFTPDCCIALPQLEDATPRRIGTPRWGNCKAGLHECVHGTSVFDAASARSHPTEVSV